MTTTTPPPPSVSEIHVPRPFRAPLSTWPGGSSMWVAGSRKWVDPLNMRVEDFDISDIALALSNICRYTGHVAHPLTVAEHSVNVALKVRQMGADYNAQMAGLLHDAAEAYISDIPKPIKDDPRMEWLREHEDHLQNLIAIRFGFQWNDAVIAAVKAADNAVFQEEWPTRGGDLDHDLAYQEFLLRYDALRIHLGN